MLCASYSPLYINLSILFKSDIFPLLPYLNGKESSARCTTFVTTHRILPFDSYNRHILFLSRHGVSYSPFSLESPHSFLFTFHTGFLWLTPLSFWRQTTPWDWPQYFRSHAPESHPESLVSSWVHSDRYAPRDRNALCILLTYVYRSQHLIHLWHAPSAALPQSERIFFYLWYRFFSHSHLCLRQTTPWYWPQ